MIELHESTLAQFDWVLAQFDWVPNNVGEPPPFFYNKCRDRYECPECHGKAERCAGLRP